MSGAQPSSANGPPQGAAVHNRVEIVDGPLKSRSFKTPTGAARAVVRHYNPSVNDNRNGWGFWQIDNGGGPRVWLQSIRPVKAG